MKALYKSCTCCNAVNSPKHGPIHVNVHKLFIVINVIFSEPIVHCQTK